LGDSVGGKEHPIGMGDIDFGHQRLSLTTSTGLLSVRRPRNRGWRSLPSRVHSLNATCATDVGRTQCTPCAFTLSLLIGGLSRTVAGQRLCRLRSIAVSNPVPTLPAYTSSPPS